MPANIYHIKGLNDDEVIVSRTKNGSNELTHKKENGFITSLKSLFTEPMFLLLLATSSIYFISGKIGDGIFMASSIILVAAISLFQESRSRNALAALKKLTQPNCKAIRNAEITSIKLEDIVVGDYIVIEEGTSVPADAIIVQSNDFSVNESILTGESLSVIKNEGSENNAVYQGTTIVTGLAVCLVNQIGNNTMLGKIGKSLENIKEEETPLQIQISSFIKMMAVTGIIVFALVWFINYYNTKNILDSLLKALTLAMSILPEEIPVAFTTFMALGAWRLMKMGIIVKQIKTVETLGSATVIGIDKTGTITENQMTLAKLFLLSNQQITTPENIKSEAEKELIQLAMWSSEPIPFDPMEIALHDTYGKTDIEDERPYFKMVHEYPLSGKPPMMTHVFENKEGKRIIAAKGAPEAMMKVSRLTEQETLQITEAMHHLASMGYRVLGVGVTEFTGNDFPKEQQHFTFTFKGLVAFYDPPKKDIASVFEAFYNANIDVKIITGDNAATTTTIARQINFRGTENSIDGEELMKLSEKELEEKVMNTNIFTRMFPEAKLKIINALKAKGQIVAMTGDGVNDAPALKAAHIGIAMGNRGTEIAKRASSIILINDDIALMVDAIAMGRRIYTNLKKAIQYIISIHVPIILTVFIPLASGWVYPNIFSPVHIIFLELIMGPTCSIIFENEPMEKNTMQQKPRPFATTFFNIKELTTSIIQGIVITLGTLSAYQIAVYLGYNEAMTRTMVFVVLITANIFLTLVNRSFYFSIFTTSLYKNNLVYIIISITIILSALLLLVPPVRSFFQFEKLTLIALGISIGIGIISVIWFEIAKWIKRRRENLTN